MSSSSRARHRDVLDAPAGARAPAPLLSAIVIARDDEARIEAAVRSVVEQECPEPFEVIVVTSGSDRSAAIVRERFPGVRVVQLPRPALPGEARNAGLRVARGRIVSFPGSHVELLPGSLAARMRAHALGYPMVSGVARNGTLSCAGWAAYFLDHSSVLPGRPSGELSGPPVRCSYERALLEAVGGFPEGQRTGEDTAVNQRLWSLGNRAYRSREVAFLHRSPCSTPSRLLGHHFRRGRGLAHALYADYGGRGYLLIRWALRRQFEALGRVRAIHRRVGMWGGRLERVYRRVLPLVVLANIAWWAGAWVELLRPAQGRLRTLLRGGRLTLVVAVADSVRDTGSRLLALLLVTIDQTRREVRVEAVPPETTVELPDRGRLAVADLWSATAGEASAPASRGRELRSVLRHDLGLGSDVFVLTDRDGLRRLLGATGTGYEQSGRGGASAAAGQDLGPGDTAAVSALAALHDGSRRASLRRRRAILAAASGALLTSFGALQLPAVAWALLRAGRYRLLISAGPAAVRSEQDRTARAGSAGTPPAARRA